MLFDGESARRLLHGDASSLPCVLRVLRVRRREGHKGRALFFLNLSDEVHAIDAILASVLNDLPVRGGLRRLSLVRVSDCTTTVCGASGRRLCIIMRAAVVDDPPRMLGSPARLHAFGPLPSEERRRPRPAPRMPLPRWRPPQTPWWVARRKPKQTPARRAHRPPLVGGSAFFGTHGKWLRSAARRRTANRPKRKGRARHATASWRPGAGQRTLTQCFGDSAADP